MLDITNAFATFPLLKTERFVLRANRDDDAADIFRIMSNPHVTRYFGQLPMKSLDDALKLVQARRTAFAEEEGIRWAISNPVDDKLIGTCGFWRLIKPHFRAEIGYELAPEWWGQGVMVEALTAALSFGFTRMGLHSVEAQIHPQNRSSQRVLEKLGFVQEGYFKENYYDIVEQGFTDTAFFSLLKATWMRQESVF